MVRKVNSFDKLENRFHIVPEKPDPDIARLSLTTSSLWKTFYDRLMSKVTRAVVRFPFFEKKHGWTY